jgi:hypothetical protein
VIVSWSIESTSAGSSGNPTVLKVARAAGGDSFTIVGESQGQNIPDTDALNTYPTRIPVQEGDLIGLFTAPASVFYCARPASGYTVHRSAFGAELALGSTTTLERVEGQQLDVSAILEPDCDQDGFGDETQDADISACNPPPKADGTLTIDANKGKVEKGRKVTLTGQLDVAANEGCEPGRTVQIQRRLKSEDDSKFETFKTVQTDAAGNYTLRQKVRKTFFYRAVVDETEFCDDETSNSQKVRVQKKKAAQEA